MGIRYTQTQGITLRLERVFAAPREEVFEAWTTAGALRRWWCPPGWEPDRIEVDLRAQGWFHLGMRRIADGSIAAVEGRFLEVEPPDRVAYTWQWRGALEEVADARVTVEFRDEGGRTRLILIHDRLPDVPMWHRHRSGWIAACDRMEQVISRQPTSGSVR